MVRPFLWIFLCPSALSISSSANAQSRVNRDGHVTHIESPASFRLNQQLVLTTPSTTFVSELLPRDTKSNFHNEPDLSRQARCCSRSGRQANARYHRKRNRSHQLHFTGSPIRPGD